MSNQKYSEADHKKAYDLYQSCGSVYEVSEQLGIAYNTLRNWAGEYPACDCPHHDWDSRILLEGSADEQLQLVLGAWGLDEIEARLAGVDLVNFRSWMRIFATALFFCCGDVPAVLKDINGEPLTAAELRKRSQVLRKPSYKESIESLRLAREEIQAILERNSITREKPTPKAPMERLEIEDVFVIQRLLRGLPQVDRAALGNLLVACNEVLGLEVIKV